MADLELFSARPLAGQVEQSTADRIRRHQAANTTRAYTGHARRFDAWCAEHGRVSLPADPGTLADYVNHLADAGRARSTLGQAVAAIRKAHDLAGHRGQPDGELAGYVMATHSRDLAAAGRRARDAPPATVPILLAMTRHLDPTRPGDVRDHLLLTLGFGMFARRSELASVQLEDVEEVDLDDGATALTVWIRETKTDRHTGAPGRVAKVVPQPHPGLDPVRWFQAWRSKLAARGITDGPLLRHVRKDGLILDRGVSGDAVHEVVRKLAQRAAQAGERIPRADEFTGHSLRAGAATQALRDGAALQAVARAGGWVDGSQAVTLYARQLEEWRDHPLRNITIR